METADYFCMGLFLFAGLFSLLASCLNWEWFFTTQKSEYIVRTLGRSGARIFYGLLGVALITCGLIGLFGGE
ncbi:hypothetical protein D0T51_08720 [Parabacteroides sp. 52]|nr:MULTISPECIES: immunity 17 family protein [unclassified Parabacteroides]NDV55805.1 hypothetical protein [Parabacteroides sp. 52]